MVYGCVYVLVVKVRKKQFHSFSQERNYRASMGPDMAPAAAAGRGATPPQGIVARMKAKSGAQARFSAPPGSIPVGRGQGSLHGSLNVSDSLQLPVR